MAAAIQLRRVGRSAPRSRSTAYRITPAMAKRAPAISSGGIARIA